MRRGIARHTLVLRQKVFLFSVSEYQVQIA
jgi:hypothetical protein